jgi:hypothetical protein
MPCGQPWLQGRVLLSTGRRWPPASRELHENTESNDPIFESGIVVGEMNVFTTGIFLSLKPGTGNWLLQRYSIVCTMFVKLELEPYF